jgi:hypothetical protein
MDVEGTTAAPKQFNNLLSAASSAFVEVCTAAIGAAAFSKQSAEDIIREYEEASKMFYQNS